MLYLWGLPNIWLRLQIFPIPPSHTSPIVPNYGPPYLHHEVFLACCGLKTILGICELKWDRNFSSVHLAKIFWRTLENFTNGTLYMKMYTILDFLNKQRWIWKQVFKSDISIHSNCHQENPARIAILQKLNVPKMSKNCLILGSWSMQMIRASSFMAA